MDTHQSRNMMSSFSHSALPSIISMSSRIWIPRSSSLQEVGDRRSLESMCEAEDGAIIVSSKLGHSKGLIGVNMIDLQLKKLEN